MDTVKEIKTKITPIRNSKSSSEKEKTPIRVRDSDSPNSQPRSSRKRSLSPEPRSERKRRKTIEQGSSDHLLAAVLQQQVEMFNKLLEVSLVTNENIKSLGDQITQKDEIPPQTGVADALNDSFESTPDSTNDIEVEPEQTSSFIDRQEHSTRTASYRERELRNKIDEMKQQLDAFQQSQPVNEAESQYQDYDFEPITTEKEAKLSKADPLLLKQGIECQRFGTSGWENIRYCEVQKQFQASPAFCALKTNNVLAHVTPTWSSISILEKFDHTLGAITNGLLQQRNIFKEVRNKLPEDIRQKVGKDFMAADSKFRKNSDELFQYVCGRRSEVLKMRRSTYKPKNKVLASLLDDIPPTEHHLFDDAKLTQAIKEQGGVYKFFPFKHRKTGGETKGKPERKGDFRNSYHKPGPPRRPRQAESTWVPAKKFDTGKPKNHFNKKKWNPPNNRK